MSCKGNCYYSQHCTGAISFHIIVYLLDNDIHPNAELLIEHSYTCRMYYIECIICISKHILETFIKSRSIKLFIL